MEIAFLPHSKSTQPSANCAIGTNILSTTVSENFINFRQRVFEICRQENTGKCYELLKAPAKNAETETSMFCDVRASAWMMSYLIAIAGLKADTLKIVLRYDMTAFDRHFLR